MSDITLSKETLNTGILFLPAMIISFFLILPVILITYGSRALEGNSIIELFQYDLVRVRGIFIELLLFLENLSHPRRYKEGDFWHRDPVPFFAKNHIQVPSRLMATIRSGVEWKKIDFCIGKVVEVNGD